MYLAMGKQSLERMFVWTRSRDRKSGLRHEQWGQKQAVVHGRTRGGEDRLDDRREKGRRAEGAAQSHRRCFSLSPVFSTPHLPGSSLDIIHSVRATLSSCYILLHCFLYLLLARHSSIARHRLGCHAIATSSEGSQGHENGPARIWCAG